MSDLVPVEQGRPRDISDEDRPPQSAGGRRWEKPSEPSFFRPGAAELSFFRLASEPYEFSLFRPGGLPPRGEGSRLGLVL